MAVLQPDQRLTDFLIQLAVNDDVRQAFTDNKEAMLTQLQNEGMSPDAAEAIRRRQDSELSFMLVNNQSSIRVLVNGLLDRRDAGSTVKALRASIKASGAIPQALTGGAAGSGVKTAGKKKSVKKKTGKKTTGKKKAAKKSGK